MSDSASVSGVVSGCRSYSDSDTSSALDSIVCSGAGYCSDSGSTIDSGSSSVSETSYGVYPGYISMPESVGTDFYVGAGVRQFF